MKLVTRLLNHLPRLINNKNRLHYQTLNFVPTHQESPQIPEFDPSIASIHSISSNLFFTLLGLCRNIYSLKRIHALLIVYGQTGELLCQTKLVSLYGTLGLIESARKVFDQITNPDLFSYKVMIRWYFINDLYLDIIGFYTCMRKCLKEHDNIVFSIVLKACSELRDGYFGRNVHCHIVKAGSADSFVLTGLVDMYAKSGEVESSCAVFDEIEDRNVVCWTSMIVGYVQNDCAEEALSLFNRMRDGLVEGNEYTFGSIVRACTKLGALHQGKWVHGYVTKDGMDLNSHLITALVDMYVKCGAIRDARSIFDELCTIDHVSWTAMVVGYTQSGLPKEAMMLFTDKKWVDILPNSVTIASVISACAQSGNSRLGRSGHGLGIKLGLEDASVTNALVDMYAKCCMIGDAQYLFETVSNKDVITWNSIIYGYTQGGSAYEALRLFHQMRTEHFWPDAVTLVTVLSACASLGAVRVGSSLHAYSIKEGLLSCGNVYVGTALLTFYAKCGDAKSAREVFDGMEEKNTITWSAMIGGYGMQGDCSGSLTLFKDMVKEKMEPSDVTFTAILSACSHTGLVGDGWRYFDSMCRQYNFVPSMKHYVCMVDLLARNGRLEEAWDFIEKMPILQSNVSLLGAFLHGCSLHSRFDFGEMAVRRMMELNPNDACYYALMSKLYASDGRWSQAYEMMEAMKMRDLSKSPGWSRVEMNFNGDFSCVRFASLA